MIKNFTTIAHRKNEVSLRTLTKKPEAKTKR